MAPVQLLLWRCRHRVLWVNVAPHLVLECCCDCSETCQVINKLILDLKIHECYARAWLEHVNATCPPNARGDVTINGSTGQLPSVRGMALIDLVASAYMAGLLLPLPLAAQDEALQVEQVPQEALRTASIRWGVDSSRMRTFTTDGEASSFASLLGWTVSK